MHHLGRVSGLEEEAEHQGQAGAAAVSLQRAKALLDCVQRALPEPVLLDRWGAGGGAWGLGT